MPVNDNTRLFARRDRRGIETGLAGALAALDSHGGFQKLSYQEQATFVFDYVFTPPATFPAPVDTPGGEFSRHQVEVIHRSTVALNKTQRAALLALADLTPKYHDGVVPTSRFAHPSTATALSRHEFVTFRSTPRQGYQLTNAGRVAVAKLFDLATGR